MTGKRTIGEVVPTGELGRRNDVLVAGPTGETLGDVPEQLLAAGAADGDGAVVLSTRDPPSVVAERIAALEPFDAGRLEVVDCTPAGPGAGSPDTGWSGPSPSDLTGNVIALQERRAALSGRGVDRTHLLFDTLSTLLVSAEAESVLQFVHHLTTRESTGLGVYPVHTNLVDDREMALLEHLFDGIIEVRKHDGDRQVRCRGFPGTPREWVTLASPAAPPA